VSGISIAVSKQLKKKLIAKIKRGSMGLFLIIYKKRPRI